MMVRRGLMPLTMGILLILLTGAPAAAGTPNLVLRLLFDEAPVGTVLRTPVVEGPASSAVQPEVVTAGDGEAMISANNSSASGRALALPAYANPADGTAPLAVVALSNDSTTSALAVGTRDFRWGADFRLFADLGEDPHDGDNLLQRGLWGDAGQWKLSVDGGKAMCLVGFGERRVATPEVDIADTRWYRATCRRIATGPDQARLTLTVRRWDGTRFVRFATAMADGNAYGRLRFARDVPISVGGKLLAAGTLNPAPDQFNGKIDRVLIRRG